MRLPDYLEQFRLALALDEKLPTTVNGYVLTAARLDRQLRGLMGKPVEIEPKLQRWHEGRRKLAERRPETKGTFRAELTVLRAFYARMMAAGRYPGTVNPASLLRYPKKRNQEYLPRPVPRDKMALLREAVDPQTLDGLRALVMTELFMHGLRRVEVERATTRDLEFNSGSFKITAHGKGGKDRIVPLHPTSSSMLASYLLRMFASDDAEEWVAEFDDKPRHLRPVLAAKALLQRRLHDEPRALFEHRGKPITAREINRVFARVREAAGIEDNYGPHSLRHSCGTELLNAGVDIRKIQEILGHDDIRTTEIYTHVADELKSEAMGSLPLPALKRGDDVWRSTRS